MIHYVYETECLVNGKRYIGVHSTEDREDGYIGSGIYFGRAVKKHGRENFVSKILSEHPSRQEADDEEARLVDSDLVRSGKYYNLRTGGRSKWSHGEESRRKMSETRIELMKDPDYGGRKGLSAQWEKMKNPGKDHPHFGTKRSEETREKIRQKALGRVSGMKGKTMSEESRKKMSDAKRKAMEKGFDPSKNFPRNKREDPKVLSKMTPD